MREHKGGRVQGLAYFHLFKQIENQAIVKEVMSKKISGSEGKRVQGHKGKKVKGPEVRRIQG